MPVIADFKTTKVATEFRKAFGRKSKLPKSIMKVLTASLTGAVKSGPATSITGSPEDGLVVKVISSATGERFLHHVRLDENLAVIGHEKRNLGAPDSSATVSTEDVWGRKTARRARLSDVPTERKTAPLSE